MIGALGVRALLAVAPGNLPRISDIMHSANAVSALDWRVLAFTLAISVVTGILFGLFPAVHVSRLDVNSSLKDTSGRAGTGRHQNRARGFLVVGEIALAVILLVGAALMIRTFASLRAVNPGFDPRNVLTLQTSLTSGRYGTTAQVDNLVRQMTQRLESLPGVQFAASSIMLPIEGGIDLPFNIAGKPPAKGDVYNGDEQWRSVSAHYFSAFKVPLLRGRIFSEHDSGSSARVIIINEAMAKKYWGKEDPIGQSMIARQGTRSAIRGARAHDRRHRRQRARKRADRRPSERDVRAWRPDHGRADAACQPSASVELGDSHLQGTYGAGAPRFNRNSGLSMGSCRLAKFGRWSRSFRIPPRARVSNMLLLTVFAGVALLLAAIGIYGLMSYSVEQRTQEIGIRVALGASGGDMLRLVILRGLALAGIGLAVGLAAAFGITRLLSSSAVRRESQRSDGFRRGSLDPGGGRMGRGLHSRAPRHPDRSHHRAALRMIRHGAQVRQHAAMESAEDARMDPHQPP